MNSLWSKKETTIFISLGISGFSWKFLESNKQGEIVITAIWFLNLGIRVQTDVINSN